MTQPPLHRVLALVEEALGLPPDERDTFVERATAGDETLAAAVRAALAAEPPSDFIEPPPPDASTVDAAPDDLLGTRLGDFELVELIGRGGMGVVYRAHQVGLERNAAVKVLPSIRRSDPLAVERFKREAIAASRLQHEALVPVLASDTEDDKAWYAMAFVEGHDLHTEIAAQASAEASACLLPAFGSREYETMVALQVARLAEGLEHAHRSGVLHRDVKPRNIMVASDGRMFLTDFGLARVAGGETLTASGAVQGTPHYMSPEQARALRDPVTERSDVYSLGVVLFELLSRRKPFQGEDMQSILAQIASGTHERLRKLNTRVPRDLATIAEKAMSHRPGDRYESAGAFALDLRRFLRSEAIAARPLPAVKRAWRWAERRPWRVASAAAAVALVCTWWIATNSRTRAMERETMMSPLLAAMAADHPTEQEWSDAWRALERMRPELLTEADLALAEHVSDRVRTEVDGRIQRIREGIAAGVQAQEHSHFGGGVLIEPDSDELFEAIVLATESVSLFPGEAELQELSQLENALPSITVAVHSSVTGSHEGSVRAQRIRLVTDTLQVARELGRLPLPKFALPQGRYRFTVVLDDGRFVELERDLYQPGVTEHLIARPHSTTGTGLPLVRVDPASARFPAAEARASHCRIPLSGAPLPAYWICETEISNRRVVQYLRESGAPAPTSWVLAGFDTSKARFVGETVPSEFDHDRWLQLPAIHIDYGSLRDTAEWFGCRVPRHDELEYAHRGPTLLQRPPASWGPGGANTAGQVTPVFSNAIDGLTAATIELEPVDQESRRFEPFGLYHTLGNVSEWTSSKALYEHAGVLHARPMTHYALSSAWFGDAFELDLRTHSAVDINPVSVTDHIGLRVARSDTPPTLDERLDHHDK